MKLSYITFLGKQHPMVFSLAATEKLEERFGSLDAMEAELHCNSLSRISKAVDAVLTILMEEGRIYCKEAGLDMPAPLTCRPANLIDPSDPSTLNVIYDAMANDASREVEVEGKNAEATPAV